MIHQNQPAPPQGNSFWIGCTGWGKKRANYFETFSALEYQQPFIQIPKIGLVQKLAPLAPSEFFWIVKAWQGVTHDIQNITPPNLRAKLEGKIAQYGFFQKTDEVKEALNKTLSVASILKAQGILFETPAAFTPTAQNRARISQFFSTLDRKNQWFIWEPQGLWSSSEILKICHDLSLVPSWDPFKYQGFPSLEKIYLKVTGLGLHRGLSESHLFELADSLKSNYAEAVCIFSTLSMWKDATRLKKLLKDPQY